MRKDPWLFALPWGLDEVGGVSQVLKNLIPRARRSSNTRPRLLIPDYGAHRFSVTRSGDVPVIRARILSPWIERGSLRSYVGLCLRWPLSFGRLCGLIRRLRPAGVNVHYPGLWCLTLLLALR